LKSKKEKRIIGVVVGLLILMGTIPSLMATPSSGTGKDLQIPFLYLVSMQPMLIAGMLVAQPSGGSGTGTIISIASEITILRPSGRD
jgi:hypothetical protein